MCTEKAKKFYDIWFLAVVWSRAHGVSEMCLYAQTRAYMLHLCRGCFLGASAARGTSVVTHTQWCYSHRVLSTEPGRQSMLITCYIRGSLVGTAQTLEPAGPCMVMVDTVRPLGRASLSCPVTAQVSESHWVGWWINKGIRKVPGHGQVLKTR